MMLLGFRVYSDSRVYGLERMGLGCRDYGSRVYGLGCSDSGCSDLGCMWI